MKAEWCIHAVGPNYHMYGQGISGKESLEDGDRAVHTAYTSSMALGKAKGLKTIGFSLLSAGIFRGPRSLEHALKLGVDAIFQADYPGLNEVHLVGCTQKEIETLCHLLPT